MPSAIQSFRDLRVWQEGHKLVLEVYRVSQSYPKEEIFGLTSQMRRSVVSVTSNIAEGFSRSTPRDKLSFYAIAKGSLTELQNQLLISKDVGYLSQTEFQRLAEHSVTVHKLLNAFTRSLKEKSAKY
jgi:four helix bundle protein